MTTPQILYSVMKKFFDSETASRKRKHVAQVPSYNLGLICETEDDFNCMARVFAAAGITFTNPNPMQTARPDVPLLCVRESDGIDKCRIFAAFFNNAPCVAVTSGMLIARFSKEFEIDCGGIVGCCIGKKFGSVLSVAQCGFWEGPLAELDATAKHPNVQRASSGDVTVIPADAKEFAHIRSDSFTPSGIFKAESAAVFSCDDKSREVNWANMGKVSAIDWLTFRVLYNGGISDIPTFVAVLGVSEIGHSVLTESEAKERQLCIDKVDWVARKPEESDEAFAQRKMRVFAMQQASEFALYWILSATYVKI